MSAISIPVTIPEEYTSTERRILESAFQDLVDTFAALKRDARVRGKARDLALLFAVDEALILRGANVDWKMRASVERR